MIRNVRLLYIHNFLNDFRIQSAFLVIYFGQITGSYSLAMSVLALETVFSALMDIPTGIFSDRIGRKYTLALGSLCAAAAISSYAFADNLKWLLMGALLSGLSQCLFNGNNNALLYESLKEEGKEEEFHHYQGRVSSMFQLALGLSALLGSVLVSHGFKFIFILGIIPQVLAAIISLFFKEPHIHYKKHQNEFRHFKEACTLIRNNPKLLLLIIGQAISYGAGESTFAAKGAFVNLVWPTWAVGIYRALNHACGFLGFWFANHFLKRIKWPYMLAIAEVYWFISQSIALVISNIFSPILLFSGTILFGPFIVSRDQLLQKEFSDAQRATLGSIASFAGNIIFALVAISIGIISDHSNITIGIGFGIFMSACSLPIYIWLFRKYF